MQLSGLHQAYRAGEVCYAGAIPLAAPDASVFCCKPADESNVVAGTRRSSFMTVRLHYGVEGVGVAGMAVQVTILLCVMQSITYRDRS